MTRTPPSFGTTPHEDEELRLVPSQGLSLVSYKPLADDPRQDVELATDRAL